MSNPQQPQSSESVVAAAAARLIAAFGAVEVIDRADAATRHEVVPGQGSTGRGRRAA